MNLRNLLSSNAAPDLEILGLAEHTDEVADGYAFVAVAANDADLLKHSRTAVAQGAQAVLYDAGQAAPDIRAPAIPVFELAARRGELAARFYQHPSAAMHCVGVTGTNGKTSVAYHVADLSTHLKQPAGYSGTLGWGEISHLQSGSMTTANAVALQRQLNWMRCHGASVAAIEVSSHALAQHRADQVQFDVAIFTNLSRDHLDYHGSFEQYAAAKRRLFVDWPLKAAVLNVDDEFGRQLAAELVCPLVTYGAHGDWCWQATLAKNGLDVCWQTPAGEISAHLPVLADYAVANLTAAMATLHVLGGDVVALRDAAAEAAAVPGRMEVVSRDAHQPTVVVDYAHTPDALSKVLSALRPVCAEKLICVVGCGGDRDQGKRPLMGAAAAAGADVVWLTSDNPRSEAPQAIIDAMRGGIASNHVFEETDRALAITQAIKAAGHADIVLIAGKGHEDYQEISGQRMEFDDRQVARSVLAALEENA